jgi:hypothetical protein
MAIVWRLGTGYTLGTDYTTNSAAAASSTTINKPSGVTDGIMLRAWVYSQVAAGAAMTTPAGWTLETAPTSRRGGTYRKYISSAAAETATSYTWSAASSGRILGVVWISTGEDPANPLDVVGTWVTEGTAPTVAGISPANATDLLAIFAYWNNSTTSSSTVNFPGGVTKLIDLSSPNTGNTSGIAIGVQQLSASGATGTKALSATPTPTNMSGIMLAYNTGSPSANADFTGTGSFSATAVPGFNATAAFVGSGAFTASVDAITASVSAAFAGSGGFTASAGDSHVAAMSISGTGIFAASITQATSVNATFSGNGSFTTLASPGLSRAAAFGGTGTFKALSRVEAFLANAPTYTAHRGGSADWPEMTMYAYTQAAAWNSNMALEVSVIRTSDGLWMGSHDSTTDRVFGVHYDITTTPWSTLQTLRTTVGNQPPALLTDILAAFPDRVFVVDDKMNSFLPQFLDTLDANGGPQRIIVKGYGPQAGDINKANAATARGYQTWGYYYHADTVNLASTQGNWSILGEDAVGAPPGDATDWAAIKSYGKPVWAHIIATASQKTYADTFSPTGYMVSGVMEAVPRTGTAATFSGTGTFSAAVVPKYSANAAFVGSGVLSALAVQAYSITAGMYGSGAFTASAGNSQVVAVPFVGAGAFTATVIQGYTISAAMTAAGSLVFQVQSSGGSFSVYVWDGTGLIPATASVWDGTQEAPASVEGIV